MNQNTETKPRVTVVAITMQAGSGGSIIGKKVADKMGFTYHHRDIRKRVSKSLEVGEDVTETIEKQRLTGIQDFISSLVNDRYLWSGIYVQHLYEVVEELAEKGSCVLVGRGCNFILPPEERLAVRVIAPLETRIQNVRDSFGVSEKEARKRVTNRDARRESFVRLSYQADINDPLKYDLVLNTGNLSIDAAVDAVVAALMRNTGYSKAPVITDKVE